MVYPEIQKRAERKGKIGLDLCRETNEYTQFCQFESGCFMRRSYFFKRAGTPITECQCRDLCMISVQESWTKNRVEVWFGTKWFCTLKEDSRLGW